MDFIGFFGEIHHGFNIMTHNSFISNIYQKSTRKIHGKQVLFSGFRKYSPNF